MHGRPGQRLGLYRVLACHRVMHASSCTWLVVDRHTSGSSSQGAGHDCLSSLLPQSRQASL